MVLCLYGWDEKMAGSCGLASLLGDPSRGLGRVGAGVEEALAT